MCARQAKDEFQFKKRKLCSFGYIFKVYRRRTCEVWTKFKFNITNYNNILKVNCGIQIVGQCKLSFCKTLFKNWKQLEQFENKNLIHMCCINNLHIFVFYSTNRKHMTDIVVAFTQNLIKYPWPMLNKYSRPMPSPPGLCSMFDTYIFFVCKGNKFTSVLISNFHENMEINIV